ncbi:unnamed protein product [Prunus armeniaca]|uniref:Endonuclease/exonuclease/phosphatase domain-containing protein n=1 Tax=Prunus armeniaca TaxID=36596 RepID=A0A6J5VFH9_PRUAR|nr:unnamed protein product [Prunus armeniaca]CAB4316932.1 unnamed protein product [Prunus armeniaca]
MSVVLECLEIWLYFGRTGYPKTNLRKHSWELLCRLGRNGSGLWIVGGDFNEILGQANIGEEGLDLCHRSVSLVRLLMMA